MKKGEAVREKEGEECKVGMNASTRNRIGGKSDRGEKSVLSCGTIQTPEKGRRNQILILGTLPKGKRRQTTWVVKEKIHCTWGGIGDVAAKLLTAVH